jgi:FMN-binding protein
VKRISYWVLSTVSAFVLLLGFDASQRGSSVTATPATIGGSTDTPSGSSSSSGSSGNTRSGNGSSSSGGSGNNSSGNSSGNGSGHSSSPSPRPTPSTVTGAVAQTVWGPVQVQLTVAGQKVTKVGILQYPDGNSRDVEIARYALPILIDETLKSQSAHIDMVSGATYTSTGYVQSLQSALDQANL